MCAPRRPHYPPPRGAPRLGRCQRGIESPSDSDKPQGAANGDGQIALAQAMVSQLGMNDELGRRIFSAGEGVVLGWPPQQREYAEGTALPIDAGQRGTLRGRGGGLAPLWRRLLQSAPKSII